MRAAVPLLLALACAHASVGVPRAEVPSRQRDTTADGFYLQPAGIADDYPEESRPAEKMRRDLAVVRELPARYLRFGIGWDSVEARPGEYDWSEWDALFALLRHAGVTPLPYVCYTPGWLYPQDEKDYWRRPPDPVRFASFVAAVVARYRGQAPSWELWNEPDNDYYWLGTVDQFAAIVEHGARAVRDADSHAKVVLGGMSRGRSPFLEALLANPAVVRAIDVVNLHGYLETWDPGRAEEYPQRIDAAAQLIHETAPRADLWLAEFGYSDWRRPDGRPSESSYAVHDYEHAETFQAVALLRAHLLALSTQQLSLTTWYRIDDLPAGEQVIGDDNNKHLGIVAPDGRLKPAFHALQLYERLFSEPLRLADARVQVRAGPDTVAHVFESSSGAFLVAAWLRSSTLSPGADPGGRSADARVETISLRLPIASGANLEVFDPVTTQPIATGAVLDGPLLARVTLRGASLFLARIAPASR
jgi:polysaccharide biosynthesis protein PslG